MNDKLPRITFAVFSVLAIGAQAQIVFNNTDGSERTDYTWTVTDLNSTSPTVSTGNGTAVGTLTGAGDFLGGESFSVKATGRYGWNTSSASNGVAGGSFSNYLAGLSVGGVGAMADGDFGVDAPSNVAIPVEHALEGTDEVLVFTADTSELADGAALKFKGVVFEIYDDFAQTDFVIYDASADAVIESRWNQHFSGSSFSGYWTLDHGDKVLIATGSDNTSTKWRIAEFTLDVTVGAPDTDPPTPSPATWASVPSNSVLFAISMTATTGSDDNGVEYFFDETSGNPGGTDSGWQSDPSYTDIGLLPNMQYSYTVIIRDTVGNSGTVSSVESVTLPPAAGRTGGPPNVVIIYADDLGYADIGHNATNPIVYTPNIDRICDEGIYLSTYMTHHVCSPSRSGLLTGRHYTEVGFGAQTGGTMDNSIPNIAKDFKAAGYATAAFGKWHNSFPPETDDGNWEIWTNSVGSIPLDDGVLQLKTDSLTFGEGVNAYGFDSWEGFYGGGHSYHTRINAREIDWWINSTWSPTDGYNTYLIRDAALNFIDQNATNEFFLYIPNECVHAPYDILNTDLQEMCDIVDDVRPDLAWSIVGELESPHSGRKVKEVYQLNCSSGDYSDPSRGYQREFDKALIDVLHPGFADLVYYTMIYAMDKSTEEILHRLDAYGLTTNTIVVFASDNGGTLSGDNYPFRGNKHQLYEGGVHVAAAVLWPEHLDANQAPYSPGDNVYSNVTQYLDWYPTLINMAGQTVTAAELDGINLTPHLLARTPVRTGYVQSYYGVDDQWAAIRTQRWKLHYNKVPAPNQVLELYDLQADVAETNNVQAAYPTERNTLITMMDNWFSSGDVSGSYYPLMGEVIPPYLEPAPEGDILEISATQTLSLSNSRNEGVCVRYSAPSWAPDTQPYDGYVHAGDIFQYDIYVAEDSDHISGFYCSPSSGPTPRYDSASRGIHLDGELVGQKILPKGQWVRILCGMGEVAPNPAFASFIALHNSDPGTYHFYIDNVVIRKNDGTIRGVTWSDASDWNTTRFWQGGSTYGNLADLPNLSYSDISLSVATVSDLPTPVRAGTAYNSWANTMGGGIDGYDPAGPGPTNRWALLTEYGLGSDPTTYTAGLLRGTNSPTSGELGTYAFRDLLNTNYMTLTFDFNRDARDVEIVVAESSNLVDWVEAVVLTPPYSDTGVLATNDLVLAFEDNLSGYPVETTRITARGSESIDDSDKGFLKLEVRAAVSQPATPANLIASVHNGIVMEWSGSNENGEYIIERALSGGSFAELVRTEDQMYTDASASGGQTYDYRVRAVNTAGQSARSDPVTITR